jgi:type IV pilus assembly protein PilF
VLLPLLVTLAACQTSGSNPVAKAESRAELHAQMAANYLRRGQTEIALREAQTALQLNADHALANYTMAVAQVRAGRPDQAERYYQRAVDSKADYTEARHNYGAFLCRTERVSQGLAQLEVALKDRGYSARGLLNLSVAECYLGAATPDAAAAKPYLQRALALSPRLPDALFRMAEAQYHERAWLSARGFIERYFGTGKRAPRALELATRIELALGAREQADKYLRELQSRYPTSPEAQANQPKVHKR